MLSRLNNITRGESGGSGYSDLDREASSIQNESYSTSGSGIQSPFSDSFRFSQLENSVEGELGSAIELSAAAAGVVPDGR